MSFTTGTPTWTWPKWRRAPVGLRVRHNRSGALGTYLGPAKVKNNGAKVRWDDRGFGSNVGNVISPAADLTPVRFTAWELIGFDGQLPYEPERTLFGPGRVRIKGGHTLYEAVTFYDNTRGEKVKLARLATDGGLRQVDRWVDPDTEVEFVSLEV